MCFKNDPPKVAMHAMQEWVQGWRVFLKHDKIDEICIAHYQI